MKRLFGLLVVVLAAAGCKNMPMAGSGSLEPQPAPEGAACYIISPADGATVGKTFTVRFGLKGMGVAPAGINMANTGHHHDAQTRQAHVAVDSGQLRARAAYETGDVQKDHHYRQISGRPKGHRAFGLQDEAPSSARG